jgi:hypothetical protein
MIRFLRPSSCLLLAGLAACGSAPPPQPAVVTSSSSNLGKAMQAYAANRYSEARNFFGRALTDYRGVDDRHGQAETLIDLADSALQQGDVAAARGYLTTARSIAEQDRFAPLLPRLALLDAYADLQSQDAQAAASALDALLENAATPADIHQAALFARTQAAFNLKAADAQAWLDKLTATAGAGADKDSLTQARLQRLQALAARGAGDNAKAAGLYADALTRYQAAYYRPGIAASHEEWAGLLMAAQDWSAARAHWQRALDVRLWMYDASHAIRILDSLQQVDTALGDTAAAKQDAELAEYLRDGGDPSQSPLKPKTP